MKKYIYYLLTVSFIFSENLFASEYTQMELNNQNIAKGMMVFDYQIITLPENESIDLFGIHYLQQVNDWFYLGFGVHAPLVKGNYGGFMTLDATIHAQQKVYDNLYINAGASLGGGGGGSSVEQSTELSGTGGFIKGYVGLGYEFNDNLSAGVNYTHIQFKDSQIDNSQLNFFIQTPISYLSNPYSSVGKVVEPVYNTSELGESILIFEMNNIFQIDPTGINKETINSIALQFSHFVYENSYLFLEIEIGYKGLPLYNQFMHGVGHKFLISPRVNLYTQIGIGSGGYSPNDIDTGAGLLIYPKLSLEYLLNNKIGISLSSGYLYAPSGTSENYTFGTALNYHISSKQKNTNIFNTMNNISYKGLRVSMFSQTELNVKVDNKDHHNINLISIQLDNQISDNLYFATQVSIAYNDFLGYPGYGELLAGIGIENRYIKSNNFQNFFQIMIGTNIHGIIVKPSIGTNYSLSDSYALFGQIGYTTSVNGINLYRENRSFSNYNIGLGLTYRFSLE